MTTAVLVIGAARATPPRSEPRRLKPAAPAEPILGVGSMPERIAYGHHLRQADDPAMIEQIPVGPGPNMPDFHLAANLTMDQWIESCANRAREYLAKAYHAETEEAWKPIIARVWNRIASVKIFWPKAGYDFRGCASTVVAYTFRFGNDIYLCRRTTTDQGFQEREMAQLLIHEVSHVVGYHDECDASKIEVHVMRKSGAGLAFENEYLQYCGL